MWDVPAPPLDLFALCCGLWLNALAAGVWGHLHVQSVSHLLFHPSAKLMWRLAAGDEVGLFDLHKQPRHTATRSVGNPVANLDNWTATGKTDHTGASGLAFWHAAGFGMSDLFADWTVPLAWNYERFRSRRGKKRKKKNRGALIINFLFSLEKETMTTSFGYCTVSFLMSLMITGCDFMLETPKTLLVTHTTNRTVYNFLFFPTFASDVLILWTQLQ